MDNNDYSYNDDYDNNNNNMSNSNNRVEQSARAASGRSSALYGAKPAWACNLSLLAH